MCIVPAAPSPNEINKAKKTPRSDGKGLKFVWLLRNSSNRILVLTPSILSMKRAPTLQISHRHSCSNSPTCHDSTAWMCFSGDGGGNDRFSITQEEP